MNRSKATLWLLLLVALYAIGQLIWYAQTPLGERPVLDGMENLVLAGQIARGGLPAEQFYRAMLYPAALAVTGGHWMLFGLLCHFANTLLTIRLAKTLWRNTWAGLLAGALVGFNPVLLHYAFDPLDITLCVSLLLGGLNAYFAAANAQRPPVNRARFAALAGLCFALAALARPHVFAVLPLLVVIALAASLTRKASYLQTLAFCAALIVPLLAYGSIQAAHSGSFRILPWQGAYNLWASNRPSANGLYLQQTLDLHYTSQHQNPTRMESEILYRQETGEPGDIDSQSAYWRSKTLESIAAHPADWAKLIAFKAYALANDFEQYNNKTYRFHKQLSPWLRFNPIGWGLLLVAATACVFAFSTRGTSSSQRIQIGALVLVFFAYGAGILIYMASGRFRVPMIPILATLAGGLPLLTSIWRQRSRASQATILVAVLAVGALSFSNFAGIRGERTYIQDTLLYADAAAGLGRDAETIRWTEAALAIDPDRQSAKRQRFIAKYNQVASGAIDPSPEFWQTLASEALAIKLSDPQIELARGMTRWNIGQPDEAMAVWQHGYESYGMEASACLGAMLLVDPQILSGTPPQEVLWELHGGKHPILAYALAKNSPVADRALILQQVGMDIAGFEALGESLARVLPLR